ncbi:hypothetical protein DE146DRAFT_620871 [Phaeosphaeria sp. MPI-PUGE-AT-0046c]|nr:hypothetical protein DE146DRAFT_620871 [Phaeosphaeria sp. MPI-PUGE-AT-0046c]
MALAPFIWVQLFTVITATPILDTGITNNVKKASSWKEVDPPDSNHEPHRQQGDTVVSRVAYTAVSLVCISLLAGMAGFRLRRMNTNIFKRLGCCQYISFVLYVFVMAFVSSAAILVSGLGVSSSAHICSAAIQLCLTFYCGSKMLMYMFLIKRIHALRAPYRRRFQDWLWIVNASLVFLGFGTIAITGFLSPLSGISPEDGMCRIGLRHYVTIPLLSFDVFINIILTMVFLYLLGPVIRLNNFAIPNLHISRVATWLGTHCQNSQGHSIELRAANPHVAKRVEKLLLRTFAGSCLVLPPTVGNLTQLLVLRGRDLGFVCLLLCSCDVTWTVCVFHWLSVSSEPDPKTSLVSVPCSGFTRSKAVPQS